MIGVEKPLFFIYHFGGRSGAMGNIPGKRADRSEELDALAAQVRELGRDSGSDEAKAQYAAVAAEYDRRADAARVAEGIDRTGHKEG